MPDFAFITQFKDEYEAAFERRTSDLSLVVNTDVQTKGNQAVWDIVRSSGSAVTRGLNGYIPAATPDENQVSIFLKEWHALDRKTGYNIFASQGDGRKKLSDSVAAKMARQVDADITGVLAGATNTGVGGPITLAMIQANLAKLGRQDVPIENPDDIVVVASIAARAELYQINQFTSHDWNEIKPLAGPVRKLARWAGVTWVFTNSLPGAGTANETLFMFHKDAVGHAANVTEAVVEADRNAEQDYSWARATQYMGSTILQQKGVLKFTHDGTIAP